MNVTLHPDKCLSCGMCASIAPDLFTLETGTVSLKKQPETYIEEDKKLAHEAAQSCPNTVIEVIE